MSTIFIYFSAGEVVERLFYSFDILVLGLSFRVVL